MADDGNGLPVHWVKAIPSTVKVFRSLRLGRAVSAVKMHAAQSTVAILHREVVHTIRAFGMCFADPTSKSQVGYRAQAMVNAMAKSMRVLLELEPNELHCCMKVLRRSKGERKTLSVEAIARSEPFDDRDVDPRGTARAVSESTVFSALTGRDDGITKWRPHACFCCNNLTRYAEFFACKRKNHQKFYKATLVFPVRLMTSLDHPEFDNVAFIAFDSPKVDAFRGVPDVFGGRVHNQPTTYATACERSAAFHLGALFVDTLSIALRPAYINPRNKGASGGGTDNQSD